jgi:hypothetical protein
VGIPKVTPVCAKEIKVKSFCAHLYGQEVQFHTFLQLHSPVLTEQEAGWGPEPVCRSWRREKTSVGNEMMIAIADQTNNSPSI